MPIARQSDFGFVFFRHRAPASRARRDFLADCSSLDLTKRGRRIALASSRVQLNARFRADLPLGPARTIPIAIMVSPIVMFAHLMAHSPQTPARTVVAVVAGFAQPMHHLPAAATQSSWACAKGAAPTMASAAMIKIFFVITSFQMSGAAALAPKLPQIAAGRLGLENMAPLCSGGGDVHIALQKA